VGRTVVEEAGSEQVREVGFDDQLNKAAHDVARRLGVA
jgi:hypothetical protein